jgi:hypothetical protein
MLWLGKTYCALVGALAWEKTYYVELSVFYYTLLYNECCKVILSSDVALASFSYPTISASSDIFLQK